MNIIKPMQQGLLTRTFTKDKRFYLGVASLSYFPFHNPEALGTEQEMWETISNTCYEDTAFDLCIPKAKSEVLMVGKCYAPNRTPTKRLFVDLDFGPIIKRIVVTGNRYWVRGDRSENIISRLVGHDWEMSDPEPFLEMDIGFKNALGGDGFPYNPLGKGYLPSGQSPYIDHSSLLPNVERPERMMSAPSSMAEPTGYGPIDAAWPQRAKKIGKKYDKNWEKERFPEPAVDMDPTYYNAAPEDQQLGEGFWRGDERFVITHMHPEHPKQESTLPQIRPRCFVLKRNGEHERWKEVGLYPETVWLFPNVARGILVSRGVFEMDTFYGVDVDTVLLAWELAGGKSRTSDDYRKSVAVREDEETADEWMMREDDLSPPEGIPEEEPIFLNEDTEDPQTLYGPILERAAAKADSMLAKAKEIALNTGLDPATYFSNVEIPPLTLPDVPKLEKMSDIPKLLEFANLEEKKTDATMAEMEKTSKFISKTKEEARKKIEDKARDICKACGQDYDELLARSKMNPPRKKPVFEKFTDVLQNAKKQLTGHPEKIAEIDKVLDRIQAVKPKLESVTNASDLKLMELESAHYDAPPDKPPQKVLDDLRLWVAEQYQKGEGCENADLSWVDLSGMRLCGINLKGATLDSANLSGTDLSQADMSETILARTILTGAKMSGVNLEKSCLGKATIHEADLTGGNLNDTIIDQTDFTRSNLTQVTFKTEMVYKSNFSQTDLSEAVLTETDFIESCLIKSLFKKTDLTKASFMTCQLIDADFTEANLTDTSFVEVDAAYSRFQGANLCNTSAHMKSNFSFAVFSGILSDSLNLRETILTDADFRFSKLHEADFGESTLVRARFDQALARDADFTDADLTAAVFDGTDLMSASFQNAIIVDADFTNAHLFGADLMFAKPDGATFEGAVVKRTLTSD